MSFLFLFFFRPWAVSLSVEKKHITAVTRMSQAGIFVSRHSSQAERDRVMHRGNAYGTVFSFSNYVKGWPIWRCWKVWSCFPSSCWKWVDLVYVRLILFSLSTYSPFTKVYVWARYRTGVSWPGRHWGTNYWHYRINVAHWKIKGAYSLVLALPTEVSC